MEGDLASVILGSFSNYDLDQDAVRQEVGDTHAVVGVWAPLEYDSSSHLRLALGSWHSTLELKD